VLSYREEKPPQVADRLLIKLGSVPIALRNRKRLVVEIFTRILNAREGQTTNIVALGAGPGLNTLEAMARSGHPDAHAWMIDLNPDSFDYGREQAEQLGIRDRVKYVEGDVTDYRKLIDAQPHLVEMIGICEYLPDETVIDIARAIGDVMPSGCYLVANSISYRHGTDRFFRRVFDLNMAHRTPKRISEMLAEGGIETLHVVPEPLGVYHVLICRKK
jgi:SAM-dependent methyltransferase